MLKLVTLGNSIEALGETSGVEDVIRRLRTEEYEKARYELLIGSFLKNIGTLRFIPPLANKRTPDMELEWRGHPIHVECKKLDSSGPSATRTFNAIKNTMTAISSVNQGGSIFKIDILQPIDDKQVPIMIQQMKELIANGSPCTRTLDDKIKLEFIPFTDLPSINAISWPAFEEYGMIAAGNGLAIDNETIRFDNFVVFYFRDHSLTTRVEAARRAFTTARRQINETGPGIIFIDYPAGSTVADELSKLSEMLSRQLQDQNRRVNAVIATYETASSSPEKAAITVAARVMGRNSRPRQAIPDEFWFDLVQGFTYAK